MKNIKEVISKIIFAVIVVACIWVVLGLVNKYNTVEVVNNETLTPEVLIEERVTIEYTALIKQAQDEARSEIDAKAKEAYDETFTYEMDKIEAQVLADYEAKISALRSEKQTAVDAYWRDKDRIVRLIRSTFPEQKAVAVAIAKCESGLKPSIVGKQNNNGTYDGGLWQINNIHDSTLRRMGLDKFDPEDASKFARMLYEQAGHRFTDWTCYTQNKIVMR